MKIKELAQKYNLSKDDFWELKRGTKSMWIITHDACEKIAAKENIQFGAPTIYRDSNKDVAIVGDAKRGNKVIWSRLILKLINAYEYGIYSDSEADSFKK